MILANLFGRRRGASAETRSAPTTWDFLRTGLGLGDPSLPVSPHLAENLSVVFGCVQVIAETVAMLPLQVYRKLDDGARAAAAEHPVAAIFGGDANDWQTATEFIETTTAHCLLRGNGFAEIIRDGRGQPTALIPFRPDLVAMVRLPSGRWAYDVSLPAGGTRRLLPEEMLHLKDRSDDGLLGKSRLARARETFAAAIATEHYAAATFKNGAAMSGVLNFPGQLTTEAARRLRDDFEEIYRGTDNAGRIAILEEGMKWQQVSVSPDDAQMLESRRFSVEALARIFRVPPPILGDFQGGNYSSISEVGRWFYSHTIMPWLNRWERAIERGLFSADGRRRYEVEFDCDLLLRGDMLTRFQSYRIAREIGLYNANELRRFEKANPRTDPGGDEYLRPANMQPEQARRPRADRGAGPVIA
ncbi:MAG TPA: phage portal protein [Stellaceae bacterium]|jgi:HK97 family phage portal protein